MQVFDKGKVYDFMGKRHIAFIFSLILIFISTFYIIKDGFNYGIDFAGGTLIQVKYDKVAPIDDMRKAFESNEILKSASITEFGSSNEVVIRYSKSDSSLGSDPAKIVSSLLKDTGNFEIRRVDMVGPKVGDELRQKGIMALLVSFVLILIYLGWRFEWRFAVAAIVSEIHDIYLCIGLICILRLEVNLDTLAAILTILGYSLNDTIVVFDRIRESIKESKSTHIDRVINEAVSHTLSRTILSSLTTFIVVFILYIWGGDMISGFSLIMMAGVIAGTYSTVFIAAQILIWFKFSVENYRAFLSDKQKRAIEKEKMRAMYEKGTL